LSDVRKHNFIDIAGQKFGRLTAIQYRGDCSWECRCACGESSNVNATKLRGGKTLSCGCLVRETNSAVQKKRQTKHGMHKASEYHIWAAMLARCRNPKNPQWSNYGGRGVRVCSEWLSFEQFYLDMGPRPSTEHSLDRIENVPLYSKATCRWATHIEQHNNTRRNRRLTHLGRTQTVAEWAREVGLSYGTLMGRVQRGWSSEDAIKGRAA
jgi:hypothetical protein